MIKTFIFLADIVIALILFLNIIGSWGYWGTEESGSLIFGILFIANAIVIVTEHKYKDLVTLYFKRKTLEEKKKVLIAQKEVDETQSSI